ncbi:MAG: 2',3'-cyclic-nucleotide 2'-phosphodiesterase, partial [uncultured Gemmatimonadetes bacterium]
ESDSALRGRARPGRRVRHGAGQPSRGRAPGGDGDHRHARLASSLRLLHRPRHGPRPRAPRPADRQRARRQPGAHRAGGVGRPAAGESARFRVLQAGRGRGAPGGHGDELPAVRRLRHRQPRVQLRDRAPGHGGTAVALPLALREHLPRGDGAARLPRLHHRGAHGGRRAGAGGDHFRHSAGRGHLGRGQGARPAGLPRHRGLRASRGGRDAAAGRGAGRRGRAQRAGGVQLRHRGHRRPHGERGVGHGPRGPRHRRDPDGPHAPRSGGHHHRRRAGDAGQELGHLPGRGRAGAGARRGRVACFVQARPHPAPGPGRDVARLRGRARHGAPPHAGVRGAPHRHLQHPVVVRAGAHAGHAHPGPDQRGAAGRVRRRSLERRRIHAGRAHPRRAHHRGGRGGALRLRQHTQGHPRLRRAAAGVHRKERGVLPPLPRRRLRPGDQPRRPRLQLRRGERRGLRAGPVEAGRPARGAPPARRARRGARGQLHPGPQQLPRERERRVLHADRRAGGVRPRRGDPRAPHRRDRAARVDLARTGVPEELGDRPAGAGGARGGRAGAPAL